MQLLVTADDTGFNVNRRSRHWKKKIHAIFIVYTNEVCHFLLVYQTSGTVIVDLTFLQCKRLYMTVIFSTLLAGGT